MSARGLQHRTTGLRARRAPIRADFQKIENPLVHSKLVRVPGYPGWPLFPFRFDRGRGAIEKAVRTSMAAARDSGSTRGNPRPSNRSAKKSGRRQTTADPHLPRSLPQIEIRFSSLDFPSSSPPGTGRGTRIETCPIFKGKI